MKIPPSSERTSHSLLCLPRPPVHYAPPTSLLPRWVPSKPLPLKPGVSTGGGLIKATAKADSERQVVFTCVAPAHRRHVLYTAPAHRPHPPTDSSNMHCRARARKPWCSEPSHRPSKAQRTIPPALSVILLSPSPCRPCCRTAAPAAQATALQGVCKGTPTPERICAALSHKLLVCARLNRAQASPRPNTVCESCYGNAHLWSSDGAQLTGP